MTALRRRLCRSAVLLVATLAGVPANAATQQPAPATALVIGTVRDTLSGQPVRFAVVRVSGTALSALTDDGGHFRLELGRGEWRLEVRRIGYEPTGLALTLSEETTRTTVFLRPLPVALAPVTVTPVPDPARDVIARTIAHKRDVLAQLHDYRYDAYVKFVVRDLAQPRDSAAAVVLITETRTAAYWEHPDRYQERIVARRQSRNLDPEDNLVSVGEIVNFNKNRIDLRKYAIVSPIADDALDHYDYHTLDTLVVDGRRVFRLAIEPKSQASPLFIGMIDIADSAYDVLGIAVGVNAAARFNYITNLRYEQRLADAGGGRWMPYLIRLTGEVHLTFSFPGFPGQLSFEHVASLEHYEFDRGHGPAEAGRYRIIVDDRADRPDSASWAAARAVPLTDAERAAWARIDSTERHPPVRRRIEAGVAAAIFLATDPAFFHFNRVDGTYLGAAWDGRLSPGVGLTASLGYAEGRDAWQYRVGSAWRLSDARHLWAAWSYHDETVHRPTLISSNYNPTVRALLSRLDPLDYYRDHGLTLSLSGRLVGATGFELSYHDAHQSSLGVSTDYTLFTVTRPVRANPPIIAGHLRALTGRLTYDSRPLIREKGEDYHLRSLTSTRITLGAELAAPDLVPSDYSYRRYTLQIERQQRTFNLGITTLLAAGGVATGYVPPQRYFTVDYGMKTLTFQRDGFNTLADTNYSGTRAAMLVVRHDFDRLLFAKSHLPLVRRLPFTFSVHGGVFWTDFINHIPYPAADTLLTTARTPYSEVGFGLGNLTPFLSPFNFAVHVTWQLSSYPTHHVSLGIGLTRP
ncbi:MAG TPA: DUF5686 family protein [Gemmatimonadales bacterium]|nr:DUF5686 family protein [Gemmatimonadales bacterium]